MCPVWRCTAGKALEINGETPGARLLCVVRPLGSGGGRRPVFSSMPEPRQNTVSQV